MKLKLGNNIRKRRRQADMTQEELAERLGVSYQAVSRWENGSTYPDIELLPTIANYFGITVDELIGNNAGDEKLRADELIGQLVSESKKEVPDIRSVIKIIRELRRDHPGSIGNAFWYNMQRIYFHEGILPELRATAEAVISGSGSLHNRIEAIKYFSEFEDEEHIKPFLDRYSTSLLPSRDELLMKRYLMRKDTEKFENERQYVLFTRISKLIEGGVGVCEFPFEYTPDVPAARRLRENDFQLALLGAICGSSPSKKYPISCDGEVDEWAADRIGLGMYRALFLTELGDRDGAFAVLGDIISLQEKLLNLIADGGGETEAFRRTEWLDRIKIKYKLFDKYSITKEVRTNDHIDTVGISGPSSFQYVMITREKIWDKLNSIKDDARYAAYIKRVEAMIAFCDKISKK